MSLEQLSMHANECKCPARTATNAHCTPPAIASPSTYAAVDADVDRFATLFSPATPPATPILRTAPATPPLQRQLVHLSTHQPRSASSDSDFGSFVSVPPTQDPLATLPFSPLSPTPTRLQHSRNQSFDFFERFAEEAKAASEKNRRGVLDELLEHEDDPLYFLANEGSGTAEGHRSFDGVGDRDTSLIGLDTQVVTDHRNADSQKIGDSRERWHPLSANRTQEAPDQQLSSALHSPSLTPQLPSSRLSQPGVPRAESSTNSDLKPKSPGALPSRWMSSLLSSHPSTASTSPSQYDDMLLHVDDSVLEETEGGKRSGDATSSLHTHTAHTWTQPRLIPPPIPTVHAHSMPLPTISHGNPFAPHTFVPPSGAPGFAGDHNWDKGFSADLQQREKLNRQVRLDGRKESTSRVLMAPLADLIRSHLPALARLPRAWTLLYSLDQHGISLNTLYDRCDVTYLHPKTTFSGAIVAIKDEGHTLFGAWVSDGLRKGQGGYYGGGESFLWTCDRNKDNMLRVFKWTGRNDYIALCEPEYISFGGGDGHYGLYIDDTLLQGTSAHCPTFDNEPLCSLDEDPRRKGDDVPFECVGLEVWAVGP